MKVDNTTNVAFGDKRNSVRIVSKDQYTVGSVWVADILHLPYGVRGFLLYMYVREFLISLMRLRMG